MKITEVLRGYAEQQQRLHEFLRERESPPDAFRQNKETVIMVDSDTKDKDLPMISDDRLIQGEILKCVDGHWSVRDGTTIPPETQLLAIATGEALQCWHDQTVVDVIPKRPGQNLPDVKELNGKIPQEEWEMGLDGQPRPPWQHVFLAYLINIQDASMFTFINNTVGCRIAVERLQDRIQWMQALRGKRVVPLVKPDSKPMKTKHGQKIRPEFTIIDWREIGGGGGTLQSESARQIEQRKPDPASQIGQPVKPVMTSEALNDSIGF
jgi:hypothetical protein